MSNLKDWISEVNEDLVVVDLFDNELLFVDSIYSNIKKLEGFYLRSKFYAVSQYGLDFDSYIEELNYLKRYYPVPPFRFFPKDEPLEDNLLRHINNRHQNYISGESIIVGLKIVTNDRRDSYLYQMKHDTNGFTLYIPDQLINRKVDEALEDFKTNLKVNLSKEDLQGMQIQ